LSDLERECIIGLHEVGLSFQEIARHLERMCLSLSDVGQHGLKRADSI